MKTWIRIEGNDELATVILFVTIKGETLCSNKLYEGSFEACKDYVSYYADDVDVEVELVANCGMTPYDDEQYF